MNSAIERLRLADQHLAITLSDLRLIYSGQKSNGGEIMRLLNDVEKIKNQLADILTLAINRNIFTHSDKATPSDAD